MCSPALCGRHNLLLYLARRSTHRRGESALNTGNAAQVWMVHSGGFYIVERRKVPDLVSRTLHRFRWEAGTTWLSGIALLIVVYYIGGGALIDSDVRDISHLNAVIVGSE